MERRRIRVQAGAGLFFEPVPDGVFVAAAMNDGGRVRRPDVPATFAGLTSPQVSDATVRTLLAPDLDLPRRWVQRVAIERAVRRFVPSLEYTWVHEHHQLGSHRLMRDGWWTDTIAADRTAARHRLHARLGYAWKAQTIVGHYEWVHASDNTDGPFSHPERAGDYRAEWARSAGVAPSAVTVVSTLVAPWRVNLALSSTWQRGAPYNITTGADVDANGLANERGGRPRNAGRLPSQYVASMQASRRFAIDAGSRFRMAVTAGVHLDNLLDVQNVMAVNAVAGSPHFGRPIAAMPGRSLRFWISVD